MLTRDQILLAIHDLQRANPAGVARTGELAARLRVTRPSVTSRVQALAAAGLVRYTPRQGATLTPGGEQQAAAAQRRLRLIEWFLGEVLALPGEVIAGEAELVARWASDRVMDGLSRYVDAARSARV